MANVVIIGNGQMAISCIQYLRAHDANIEHVISTPLRQLFTDNLAEFCDLKNISHNQTSSINTPETLDRIRQCQPDLVLSINNFKFLDQELLSIPKLAAINFHNSYLPNYPGLDACGWAILNGEKEHGATWHLMNEIIDAGAILVQQKIPISDTDTALSLTLKTIKTGIELFEKSVSNWLCGEWSVTAQSRRSAAAGKAKENVCGKICFDWSFDKINRWFKGLSYYPLPSKLPSPYFEIEGQRLSVRKISRVAGKLDNRPAGTVLDKTKRTLTVMSAEGPILLSGVHSLH